MSKNLLNYILLSKGLIKTCQLTTKDDSRMLVVKQVENMKGLDFLNKLTKQAQDRLFWFMGYDYVINNKD